MTTESSPSGVDHPLADAFRGRGALEPALRVLRKSSLLVTEFKSNARDGVVTGTVPKDDAYVVTLHLRERPSGAMCAEGRWIQPENFGVGNAGMVDLRMELMSEYAGPFHYLSFYLTRQALDGVADDAGVRRVRELRHQLGVGFSDPDPGTRSRLAAEEWAERVRRAEDP